MRIRPIACKCTAEYSAVGSAGRVYADVLLLQEFWAGHLCKSQVLAGARVGRK